jgi:hypothetical protein
MLGSSVLGPVSAKEILRLVDRACQGVNHKILRFGLWALGFGLWALKMLGGDEESENRGASPVRRDYSRPLLMRQRTTPFAANSTDSGRFAPYHDVAYALLYRRTARKRPHPAAKVAGTIFQSTRLRRGFGGAGGPPMHPGEATPPSRLHSSDASARQLPSRRPQPKVQSPKPAARSPMDINTSRRYTV